MMGLRPLPVGIDDFEKVISGNYYYVDKTWMIKELLDKKSEVNLFTRPRRFGKTLNMSMLQYYFENTGNETCNQANQRLFDGLKIATSGECYTNCMATYPVISLSLKSSKQTTFSSAYYKICEELWREFERHEYVLDALSGVRRDQYLSILNQTASQDVYSGSLRFLSEVLSEYHGKSVIILIDEYDVPLENAYYGGFYEEMTSFIRSLFESALKTNPSLEFAVITGCLRISKESIFTGLNNLNVISILSNQYDEYFGFQQKEIDTMLQYYGLEENREIIREWYDGYLFGEAEVYNPWSVINYIVEALAGKAAFPRPYWTNTSSNQIVRDLIERADISVKMELECLISGGAIEKPVHEDITYDSIYDSEDSIWNFLLFTGYLRKDSMRLNGDELYVSMTIPNREIRYIYNNSIRNWFRDEIKSKDLSLLYQAMLNGDSDTFQKELSIYLQSSISYLDSREAFYHGFLLGVLGNLKDFLVKSNRESGDGRLDIVVRSLNIDITPIILELKVSDTFKGMVSACEAALKQTEKRQYSAYLADEGYSDVLIYGIAFFRKQCMIKMQRKKL